MTAVIYFYLARKEYGEFSNFARYPLLLDGKTWPTAEIPSTKRSSDTPHPHY